MLSHFPTVTQSTGFQPEHLLTAHSSVLYKECQEHQGWCHTRHNTAQEQNHRFHGEWKAYHSQGAYTEAGTHRF